MNPLIFDHMSNLERVCDHGTGADGSKQPSCLRIKLSSRRARKKDKKVRCETGVEIGQKNSSSLTRLVLSPFLPP